MTVLARQFLTETNFLRLFLSFFLSEFGGFLTNTAILLHINHHTDGDLFYLGLAQILFVLPLAIGTALGGVIGEAYNKKNVMILCEIINMMLITSLIYLHESVLAVVLVRAVIVFCAGVYNPSRQAVVQEIIDNRFLRIANSGFSSSFALFHAISPLLGVYLYRYFGGIQEIFALNSLCYMLGVIILVKMHYMPTRKTSIDQAELVKLGSDFRKGITHVYCRRDLLAIQLNFLIGGITMGVFYPTILPYIKQVFSGDETLFSQMMFCLSIGAILGSLISPAVMKLTSKGKILVTLALGQASLIFLWTNTEVLWLAFLILFIWGVSSMISTMAYINYVQVNVKNGYRTRTFSIMDLTISVSSFIGGLTVMVMSGNFSSEQIITLTSLIALVIIILRCFSRSVRTLYQTST